MLNILVISFQCELREHPKDHLKGTCLNEVLAKRLLKAGVCVFVVLAVVGFMKAGALPGLGGLWVDRDGTLFRPTLLFGCCWKTITGRALLLLIVFVEGFCKPDTFAGIFLIVFVLVALFRELRELTKLARELDLSTLLLLVTLV